MAALDFAIKGAGKFNVDSAMLITELYQLGKNRTRTKEPNFSDPTPILRAPTAGFPRESAELVGRVYRAHQSQIRKKLEDDTLQVCVGVVLSVGPCNATMCF